MGDRCLLLLTYRKADEAAFAEVIGKEWYDSVEDEGTSWKTVLVGEANWGLYTERETLAKQRVPFLGEHEAGCEYLGAVFAAHGGEHADVMAHAGEMLAFLDEAGRPKAGDLRQVKRYLRLAAKARSDLGLDGPGKKKS